MRPLHQTRVPGSQTTSLASWQNISRHKTSRRDCRSSRTLVVKAAWGDDIVWSPAKVVLNKEAAKGFHTLLLEIGSAAAQKYTNPGQYLQVRLKGGKAGFYALASTPESSADGTVELLVRCRGENSEQLCQIKDGTEVEASPVDGPGFRMEKAGPKAASQVFIFATGSGITPIKALIESGALQAEKRKSVRLFWGTQNSEMTPYQDTIAKWEASGVDVVPVYSADGKGYVQDVFEQENEMKDGSAVAVILCGHKDMTEKISKQMQAAGVDKEKILLNF